MTKDIGKRLKYFREQNKMSQLKVAETLGISRQAISQWERNQAIPDIENLMLLSKVYQVSIDELLGVEDSNESNDAGEEIRNEQQIIIEKLCLAVVMVLLVQFPILGGLGIVGILFWMKNTSRTYRLLYILSAVCLVMNIYNSYIFINHMLLIWNNTSIEKI